MKQTIFFLLILIPFCGFTQIPEEWSGHARFTRKTVSGGSDHSSSVTYIIDISINKGKGQATASYSVQRNIAYKGGGAYTESGSCSKSAETELALTFTDDGKHYDLAIGVPECSGILTINNDGSEENRDFGMDESIFQLESKERGNNIHVLSGNETNSIKMEDGTSTETYTWHFTRGTMPPDLLVLSPEYETWMPEPGENEKTFGSVISVGLVLKRKDGKPLDIKAKEFFVQLLNTSSETGLTINYPPGAMLKGAYDMALMDEKMKQAPYFDGQKFTIPSEDGKSGGFHIISFDGGAYTTLEVKAIMEDGSEIKGHYGKPEGPTSIPYPYRDPGRKIAKAWLLANGTPNETDDKEVTPDSDERGDGLTAYEEYRGVMTMQGFIRLSPAKKELAIRVDREHLPIFKKGIALFGALTNITPVICNTNQLDDSRIFNANALTQRAGIQYGLYIKPKNLGNEKGEILPAADQKNTRNSDVININNLGIMKRYDSMASIKKLPYSAEEDLTTTVAHYLCRAVGIPPHGAPGKGELFESAGNLNIKYLQEDGSPIATAPKLISHLVGGQANDASGDAGCIMCQNNKYEWAFMKNGTNITYRKVPPVVPGKKLCTSALGTKLNSNGQYFGNAQSARGNCLSHIKIKSW